MLNEGTLGNTGTTKVDRYGWTIKDSPGVLLQIPKSDLLVDEAYQRNAIESKILALARRWSWIAAGVIRVADRDGTFYVIDGQHRVLAARRRADIWELPCIVFETESAVVEAEGFLIANTQRKPISSVDQFRALVVTQDPAALLVKRLCDQVGRIIAKHGAPNTVRCVSAILKLARTSPDTLERLWPLINSLCFDQPLNEKIACSLVWMEERMPPGESLLGQRWRQRIARTGLPGLLAGADRAQAFFVKSGPRIWATGMVQALNHGCQNRLKIAGLEERETSGPGTGRV